MAAIDTPFLGVMSKPSHNTPTTPSSPTNYDPHPPTVAAFAPTSTSGYSATTKQRSTVIVHKKSPLLVATPPQITRALAHSHPFILLLNRFVGLLSWSTGEPWESFLLVAAFWAGCLYGDEVVRYATPLNGVLFLILGMWSRRYSPLSSTSKTGDKYDSKSHKRTTSTSPQHKSLDEIVATLTQFTSRCNILLEPFLVMTDFLSTQSSATSATTRPALTTLLIRIILVTPLWILLTLPPFYILTSRRTILSIGTVMLTWHSKPARVSRVILWRSVMIRRASRFVTGLNFDTLSSTQPTSPTTHSKANELATTSKKRRPDASGVRFTFILYENQRRWIGLGWTTSLFAYERAPWTDEHLNAAHTKDDFELPRVETRNSRWRWVEGSQWEIDHGAEPQQKPKSGSKKQVVDEKSSDTRKGWIYYDNKWQDAKSEDGWGRYTRRRKWFRDAELVEITPSTENSPIPTPNVLSDAETDNEKEKIRRAKEYAKSLNLSPVRETADLGDSVATIVPDDKNLQKAKASGKDDDAASVSSSTTKRRSGWFGRSHSYTKSVDSPTASGSGADSAGKTSGHKKRDSSVSRSSKSASVSRSEMSNLSSRSRDGPEDDVMDRWRDNNGQSKNYGVGEDVYMSLG